MKTSARNCFYGEVVELKNGAVNDEVTLKLPNGTLITAIITHESTLALNLKLGASAFALIKASFVILTVGPNTIKVSARNRLSGRIIKINQGAVNSEVSIDLGHGQIIVAIITNESCENLEFQVGDDAAAMFKASHVIVGVED